MSEKELVAVTNNLSQFTPDFVNFIQHNLDIYHSFEGEALAIAKVGFQHYSARTILHYIRHHTALKQQGGGWKVNNNWSPYLARLFAILNPTHANLFSYRETKAVFQPNDEDLFDV